MKLKIVGECPESVARAKRLGFSSHEWKRDGVLEGPLHPDCLRVAAMVWQAAFHTHRFSPRNANYRLTKIRVGPQSAS